MVIVRKRTDIGFVDRTNPCDHSYSDAYVEPKADFSWILGMAQGLYLPQVNSTESNGSDSNHPESNGSADRSMNLSSTPFWLSNVWLQAVDQVRPIHWHLLPTGLHLDSSSLEPLMDWVVSFN